MPQELEQVVELPNGDEVSFPEDFTPDQITGALRSNFPQLFPAPAEVEQPVQALPDVAAAVPEQGNRFLRALKRGYASGQAASELGYETAPSPEVLNRVAELQRRAQQAPPSESLQRFQQAPISSLLRDPLGIPAELVAESLAAQVPVAIRKVPAALAAGAAGGAALGAPIAGIGAVPGALTGLRAGFITGMGLTSAQLEYAGKFMQSLQEAGVDTGNAEQLKQAFDKPELIQRVRTLGLRKGIPIGVVDALSAGVAGKILARPAVGVGGKLLQAGKEAAVQGALGGFGEALGEKVAGEEFSLPDILAEVIAEPVTSVPEVAVGTVREMMGRGGASQVPGGTEVPAPAAPAQPQPGPFDARTLLGRRFEYQPGRVATIISADDVGVSITTPDGEYSRSYAELNSNPADVFDRTQEPIQPPPLPATAGIRRRAPRKPKPAAAGAPLSPAAAQPFQSRFPVGAQVDYLPPGALPGGKREAGSVAGYRQDPTTGDWFAEITLPSGRKEFAGDINDIQIAKGATNAEATGSQVETPSAPPQLEQGTPERVRVRSVTPHGVEAEPGAGITPQPVTPKSSTQLTVPAVEAHPFTDFARSIPDSEVYHKADETGKEDFGIDTEPHITVLFGLTEHEPEPVRKLVESKKPITVKLGKLSMFESKDYDVLKLDVTSPELHALNAELKKLPNEQTFPDYKPHLTIAYLKKGEGKKYVGDTRFEGKTLTFNSLTFSPPSGEIRDRIGKPELPFTQPVAPAPPSTSPATLPEPETPPPVAAPPVAPPPAPEQTAPERPPAQPVQSAQETVPEHAPVTATPPPAVAPDQWLSVQVPDIGEARDAARFAARQIEQLRQKLGALDNQIAAWKKTNTIQRGPMYQRGHIKKSVRKSEREAYQSMLDEHRKIFDSITAVEMASDSDRKATERLGLAKRVNDPAVPLLSRLLARKELFFAENGTPPEGLLSAIGAETDAVLKRRFPDITPEESKRLGNAVVRAYSGGDVDSAFQLDPELNLTSQRNHELLSTYNPLTNGGITLDFSDDLKNALSRYINAFREYGDKRPFEPLSRETLDRLVSAMESEAKSILERREAESKAAAIAAAEMEKKFTRVITTEKAPNAVEAKNTLLRELEKALSEAPDQPHGKATITIEIPGDGTFKIFNDKASIQGVLDKAKRLSTATTTKAYSENKPTREQGREWLREAEELAKKEVVKLTLNPNPNPDDESAFQQYGVTSDEQSPADERGAVAPIGSERRLALSTEPERRATETVEQRFKRAQPDARLDAATAEARRRLADVLGPSGTFERVQVLDEGLPVNESEPANALGQASQDELRRIFRREIIFVDLGPASPAFNGVMFDDISDAFWVNVRSSKPYHFVIGHELMHHIKAQDSTLYRRFIDAFQEEIQNLPAYQERLNRIADAHGDTRPWSEKIIDELAGDFAGDSFLDPQFYQKLADRVPGLFNRLAGLIRDFFARIKSAFTGANTSEFITDVDRAQNLLADAMAEFAQKHGRTDIALSGEPRFSRDAASLGNPDLQAEIESALNRAPDQGVRTKVFNAIDTVLAKQEMNPEVIQAGIVYARNFFGQLGLEVEQDESSFWKLVDEQQEREDTGRRMVDALRKELAEQQINAREKGHLGNLINSIRVNMTPDRIGAFSEETRAELYSLAQGEASQRGLLLAMLEHGARTVEYVARNVNAVLQRVYSDNFGGDILRKFLDETRRGFGAYFTDEVIAQVLEQNKELTAAINRIAQARKAGRQMPSVPELIKRIFDTPLYRQSEIRSRFINVLMKELDADPKTAEAAADLLTQAFSDRYGRAKDQAKKRAIDALQPAEQRALGMRKRTPVWKKIERAVNSGVFETGKLLRDMAEANHWKPLTDADASRMRNWAQQMQRLRELTPEEETEIENFSDDPDVRAMERQRALSDREAETRAERVKIKQQIETLWSRLSHPLNLWGHSENVINAAYEWASAVLLLKFGFPTRQLIDVGTQAFIYTPTRALAAAWERIQSNQQNGRPLDAPMEIGRALADAYKSYIRSFKPALASMRAVLKGAARSRNVENLVSQIALFERIGQQADEEAAKGNHVKANLLTLVTWVKAARQFAAALDQVQSIPAEFQEMREQTVTYLREHGKSIAEAKMAADEIVGDPLHEWQLAIVQAKLGADRFDLDASPDQIKSTATDIAISRAYQRMREAGLPADDWHNRNLELREVIGWNVKEEGGLGGFVAAPLRALSEFGAKVPPVALFSVAFGRFSNAIAISAVRAASFTPAGFFPQVFGVKESEIPAGTDIAIRGSPWYRTAADRRQRKIEAAIGTMLGSVAIAFVASGAASVRWKPPDDKEERELWFKLHKPQTVEFNLPDGSFIPISLTTGWLRPLAPYFVAAGALIDRLDQADKRQERLNKEAAKRGLPPGKAQPLSPADYAFIAGQAAWSTLIGGRTAQGLVGSLTDYSFKPNLAKSGAAIVSSVVPGLPAIQEASRAAGIYMDPKAATFFDYLVPLETSAGRSVNLLGDQVSTESDIQRVIQVATGGTYPFPVQPQATAAYQALFASGYRPPSIDPNKGYAIGNQFRPFTPEELHRYTQLRGNYFKQTLGAIGPSASAEQAQDAYQQANAQALSELGVTPTTRPVSAGTATAAAARTVSRPSGSSVTSGQRPSYFRRTSTIAGPRIGLGLSTGVGLRRTGGRRRTRLRRRSFRGQRRRQSFRIRGLRRSRL